LDTAIRLGKDMGLPLKNTMGKVLLLHRHNPVGPLAVWGVALALGFAGFGCDQKGFKLSSQPADAEAKAQSTVKAVVEKTAPLPGTVGATCYLEGMRGGMVQGFGLVVGLSGTGSRECPEALRKELMATIVKYQKLYGEPEDAKYLNAGALLDSPNTAVVKVTGMIPAGVSTGSTFDLGIQALPNTGTTSLENGRLYTCDLRVYAGPLGQVSKSRILARGEGAVFINPFEKKKYRGATLLRRNGLILGGGTNLEDRKLHLVLYQSSYGTARSIEQKINSIFGPPPENPLWQTAKAVSADKIEIHVPRQYQSQLAHFLGLVMNIYIRSDPSYIETMANELTQKIGSPTANGPAISYAWEGMGRSILPLIQPLYTSSNKQAAYYSARAGARLGDNVAMEQLGIFAADPKDPYRRKALRTLGYCRDLTARRILRKLVDDSNMKIRIMAYKGLARLGDISVETRNVGDGNLTLDVVQSKAWPLVYAARSKECRIVLFGAIKLEPPVFYCHPDDSITLSAAVGEKTVHLLRKTPSGKSSGKIEGPLELPALIALLGSDPVLDKKTQKVYGVGLPYSHIVTILYQLCKDGSIPAKFQIQDFAATTEPPEDLIGRPEKD
jgi:hypothetical protein